LSEKGFQVLSAKAKRDWEQSGGGWESKKGGF